MSWDELVAAALIGTDRRPVAATVPDGSPPGLERALAERGAEDRLLGAAAAWTVARRAGAVAGAAAGVAPVEEDDRPLAPAASLRAMLEGDHPELVPEWLALAEQRGLRPPPELVPELLDHAAGDPSLHAAVGEAAGPLGRWLAERSPRWSFVRGAGDDVEAVWAGGESAERRALLERLRRRDPAAARELLERTLADETWEDRAAFVELLAHGLSDADEPLLEAALDDRRKPVRDAAAHLLHGLPRSRFAARMAARAAPLLRVEDGRIVAELPGEPDAAARRDGVPAGGRRSARLSALLAATPLATWTGAADPAGGPAPAGAAAAAGGRASAEGGGPAPAAGAALAATAPASPARLAALAATAPASPARLAALAATAPASPARLAALAATAPASPARLAALPVADDLAGAVHGGWMQAAVAQRDAAWSRALWPQSLAPELLLALPREEAERLAAAAPMPDLTAQVLSGQWGPELSRAAVAAIHARRSAGQRGHDVDAAGYHLDPALAPLVEDQLRDLGGRDIRHLCDVVGARAAMLRELP